MNSKISVIVPIYKVEKYLKACVNSIANQTYKNLEIILVDDGSPDNCGKMCDDFAKKDSRIKAVHKQNGGLSDARNAGYPYVTGDFVAFIDSDDCIALNMFEVLLSAMEKENSDIAECGVIKFTDGNIPNDEKRTEYTVKSFDTASALKELINDGCFHQHVWNKLYRVSTINGILFEKGKLNEDEFWTYQIFGNARKITKVTNGDLYYYLQRGGSIMGEGYNLRRLDGLQAKSQRQMYIEKNFPAISSVSKVNLYLSCFYAYQMTLKYLTGDERSAAIKTIEKYAEDNRLTLDDINTVQGSTKQWLKLGQKHFALACKMRNFLKVGL